MKNFAVVKNYEVINMIVADSKETAESLTSLECVEYATYTDCGIGWTYIDGVLSAPLEESITE
jgi:hypothetical protein